MGMLIDGDWSPDTDRFMGSGAFVREQSDFDRDPAFGTSGSGSLPTGRYLLIASTSCPWSHRVLLVRAVLGLEGRLPLWIAGGPRRQGYALAKPPISVVEFGDPPEHVHQLYSKSDAGYTGRATVPILWDRQMRQISSNSSARIMRALQSVIAPGQIDLAPDELAADIERMNVRIYRGLANAVYRAGLATQQAAYDEAVAEVFATLDWLDSHLARNRYLLGSQITEADLCLFPTLVRFDPVYATHFRCTRQRLVEFPSIWAYARELFSWPGVKATVDLKAIQEGYFLNDGDHNPHGIISAMPRADWSEPHHRDTLGPAHVRVSGDGVRQVDPAEGLAGAGLPGVAGRNTGR